MFQTNLYLLREDFLHPILRVCFHKPKCGQGSEHIILCAPAKGLRGHLSSSKLFQWIQVKMNTGKSNPLKNMLDHVTPLLKTSPGLLKSSYIWK